tara:strand:+ start:508 stop:837 length:330 start_codon:yes stop_codon:yes gene_type:complete
MAKIQDKFLMFIDAADDAAVYPVSNLLAMTVASDGQLLLKFKSSVGGNTAAEHDSVALTITADTEKTVMQAIANACADAYSDATIVVCDDVNSVFLHADILSCAITLDT